ncbi:hypothetical protein MJO29_000269 [Puccinia striiformis f. sp. tritici]|nr:hypothetical protein MJO29_000269 [Puccinia striiformis f. sp. tritici]
MHNRARGPISPEAKANQLLITALSTSAISRTRLEVIDRAALQERITEGTTGRSANTELLPSITRTVSKLTGRSSAIANDGRSYTKELFERANQITCKSNLKSTDQLDKLSKLVKKVEELRQSEANEELELSEIPEEFLDLLMCTLMKEPVILPTSKTTVNLSTIKQHFLSDATDPFN